MTAPPPISWRAHVLILVAILATAIALSALLRNRVAWSRATRWLLASLLAANELAWYAYRLHQEGFHFPDMLPLQLCDVTLWLTVIAALTLAPGVYEVAYFWGLGGSGMALLTPDLWVPFPSYPAIYFFLSHGLVVVTLLVLTGSRLVRPRPGSLWRAFLILNAYTAAMAAFDAIFKTNYMYLCEKPGNASLLDYFGPWPAYVFVADVFAQAVFWLLWLPVRRPAEPVR